MPRFTPAPAVKEIADELIPLYHQHLITCRVNVEYYFSDRTVGDHAVCKFGKTHAIKNLNAFLAHRDNSEQFDPLTFVCVKCLNWKPDAVLITTEINGKDYEFDEACRNTLDEAKIQNPDDGFLSWLQGKAEQAQQKTEAGAPEGAGSALWVIEIFEPMWKDASEEARRAMVDSRLSDCGAHTNQSGDVILTKLPADIIEHTEVIQRHGLGWRAELRTLDHILRDGGQMSLEMVAGGASDATEKAA